MKPIHQLQTMACAYQEICQGEEPWVALGNFMNYWFDYAKDRRAELVVMALSLPNPLSDDSFRWAVFCAASVEYLCDRYRVPCPSWVHNPAYCLSEPWFDAPMAHKPEVREWLIQETPEPFTRRNIYCGNRMFNNKWELAEQYAPLFARRRSGASTS
jgi:hypothetical protein